MSKKKIGFFKMGSFSHTNEKVKDLLIKNFPEYELEVIDIWDDLIDIKNPLLWFSCAKDYLIADLIKRRTFIDSVYRTEYFFNLVRKKAHILTQKKNYTFTFQTQSFFDVSFPGIPNFLYKNAAINFTMSTHVSQSIYEHYHCAQDKIKNVYVGSNSEPTTIHNDARYKKQNILFLGVAWERKGGPQLLKAFKIVREVLPDATLTIVGCSPKIDVENCTIIGRVPLNEVNQYYAQASIFCLPTRLEPFGIVFIEAFSNKLPVIASNIGAIPDFVSEGKSGYAVDPDDIESLAAYLIELLSSPTKCKEFGEAGFNLIKDRYTWESTGKRLHEEITQHLASISSL